MKRKVTYLIFLSFLSVHTFAQDLDARVQILSPHVQNTNKRSLTVLENAIKDFLNTRKWSSDSFQPQEKIDCNFVINITEWDGSSNFKADAQIQSNRPVYGATYSSTILNITDKDFNFSYAEGQPLDYSDQNYINNLSSLLAYYAYVIVGLDYDSFSLLGGSSYYTKAQNVVNNAQSSSFAGWKAFEGLRNRFWLSENLNNTSYNPIRETLYNYHRNGLDILVNDQKKARNTIIKLLPDLQKVDKQKQGSMLNQLFFTAKADEIVNILKQASTQDKSNMYDLLTKLDPPNLAKYQQLKTF